MKLLHACLGVAILVAGIVSHGSDDQDSQDCHGRSKILASTQTAGPTRSTGRSDLDTASTPKAHSVRLSWDASVPASDSPADAIKGYNIYRRGPGKDYERINRELILGTTCVDHSVKAGRTYQYQAA